MMSYVKLTLTLLRSIVFKYLDLSRVKI